jgi:sucrose phosphorylase
VLVEVHGHYQAQLAVANRVDWVYDFALPPLVLHTLYSRDAAHLTRWLAIRPPNAVTVLDTHDGIGVLDVDADRQQEHAQGLLPPEDIASLVETIHARSRGESRLASGGAASNVDADQVNCTLYDALGRRDTEYLIARAIQCCVPGIPQIYYVGLLAGGNDLERLRRTGVGRDINRHYYTEAELERDLQRPVVQALIALLRIRNSHPAFGGRFRVAPSPPRSLVLEWTHDAQFARLDVDLTAMSAALTCSAPDGGTPIGHAWHTRAEARQ